MVDDQLGQVSPGHRVWRVNPGLVAPDIAEKTNTSGENSKHGTGTPICPPHWT
ncbi:hypothetical protein ACLB1E_12495 [Escherichia coli]